MNIHSSYVKLSRIPILQIIIYDIINKLPSYSLAASRIASCHTFSTIVSFVQVVHHDSLTSNCAQGDKESLSERTIDSIPAKRLKSTVAIRLHSRYDELTRSRFSKRKEFAESRTTSDTKSRRSYFTTKQIVAFRSYKSYRTCARMMPGSDPLDSIRLRRRDCYYRPLRYIGFRRGIWFEQQFWGISSWRYVLLPNRASGNLYFVIIFAFHVYTQYMY